MKRYDSDSSVIVGGHRRRRPEKFIRTRRSWLSCDGNSRLKTRESHQETRRTAMLTQEAFKRISLALFLMVERREPRKLARDRLQVEHEASEK
jgi:hypothetical protein